MALPSFLARPKSMSLILVPVLLTHMMFSGLRSRWTMPCLWMYSTPSDICLMYWMHSRSVSSKSSSMMRSNSSPPDTLREQKGRSVHKITGPGAGRGLRMRWGDGRGTGRKAQAKRGLGFLQLPEFQSPALSCWSQFPLCEEGLGLLVPLLGGHCLCPLSCWGTQGSIWAGQFQRWS